MKKLKRGRKARKREQRIWQRVGRWFARYLIYGLLGFVLVSVAAVTAYRWLPVPLSSIMLQNALAQRSSIMPSYHYQWQTWSKIAAVLPLAVIAGEDQRFPSHHGFDLKEIAHAIRDYRSGKRLRGASTISQQVAKNLFLWSDRSLLRKGLEAWLTALIELLWPKQRILEVYLNIVLFGFDQSGRAIYGAASASQYFFHKPAAALTAADAALLAAVLPGPGIYKVDRPSARVRQRQQWIQQQMRQLGGIRFLQKL